MLSDFNFFHGIDKVMSLFLLSELFNSFSLSLSRPGRLDLDPVLCSSVLAAGEAASGCVADPGGCRLFPDGAVYSRGHQGQRWRNKSVALPDRRMICINFLLSVYLGSGNKNRSMCVAEVNGHSNSFLFQQVICMMECGSLKKS